MSDKPWRDLVDNHDSFTDDQVANLMRAPGVGVENRGRRRIAQYLAQQDSPSVLDAACGNCVNYEAFSSIIPGNDFTYVGVDRGHRFLDNAFRRYGENDNFSVVNGFIEELPFEDDSHDFVIIRHVLEHLPEGYEVAIEEALRVARYAAIVVFFEPLTTCEDKINKHGPDEHGASYYWNTYNGDKFEEFINGLPIVKNVDMETVATPGAHHYDTIFYLSK